MPMFVHTDDLIALQCGSLEELGQLIESAVDAEGVFEDGHTAVRIIATHPHLAYVLSDRGEVQRVRYSVRDGGKVDILSSDRVELDLVEATAATVTEAHEAARTRLQDARQLAEMFPGHHALQQELSGATEHAALTALSLLRQHVRRDSSWGRLVDKHAPGVLREHTDQPHTEGQSLDPEGVAQAADVLNRALEDLEAARCTQTDVLVDTVSKDIKRALSCFEDIEGVEVVEEAAMPLIKHALKRFHLASRLTQIGAAAARNSQTERETV